MLGFKHNEINLLILINDDYNDGLAIGSGAWHP